MTDRSAYTGGVVVCACGGIAIIVASQLVWLAQETGLPHTVAVPGGGQAIVGSSLDLRTFGNFHPGMIVAGIAIVVFAAATTLGGGAARRILLSIAAAAAVFVAVQALLLRGGAPAPSHRDLYRGSPQILALGGAVAALAGCIASLAAAGRMPRFVIPETGPPADQADEGVWE